MPCRLIRNSPATSLTVRTSPYASRESGSGSCAGTGPVVVDSSHCLTSERNAIHEWPIRYPGVFPCYNQRLTVV